MKAGQVARVSLVSGSQVGDINIWSAQNPKERMFTGKTRQIHSSHLSVSDRIWSNLPYLRPLATITGDSLRYGIDGDGGGVHDVIGTRCDPHTIKLMTGVTPTNTCHQNLTRVAEQFGLVEADVHDVFNIFMCTGFTRDKGQYFSKPSPARKGDYIEWIAEMDLLVGLSACPFGDVSVLCGTPLNRIEGFPLLVEIFDVKKVVLEEWECMNSQLGKNQ